MSIYISLSSARAIFTLEKKLAMSKISNNPPKKRQGVGASCSSLLCYLHPFNFISGRYDKKEKRDALGGIIITRRDVIRVIRREQLYILMKHEDFGDYELHYIHKWVRVVREGSELNVLEYSKEKEYMGEVMVKYDALETPMHANTQENINALLADGYEVDDDRLPAPGNTPINTGKKYQPVYK